MPKKGYKQTKEHIKKNREAGIKRWENLEYRKMMTKAHKGKTGYWEGKKRPPISEEWRKNLVNSTKKGNKHWNWKGGKFAEKGYIVILKRNHPFCDKDGYVKRSRLVMEKHLGRFLLPEEIVHHINKIRDDDRIENLMAFISTSAHIRFHHNPNNVKPEEIIFDDRYL